MVISTLNIYLYIYVKSFFFKFVSLDLLKYLNNFYKIKILFSYTVVALPNKVNKFTVVRSPFVSKLSREQFELKTYKNILIIKHTNFFLNKVFLKFIHNFKNSYIGIKFLYNYL